MASQVQFDLGNANFDQIALLIQLRYELRLSSPKIVELIRRLGFGPIVTYELMTDREFRQQTIAKLDTTLETLQAQYQSRYGDFNGRLSPEDVEQAFQKRIPSLKVMAALNNPYIILQMERYFKLPETGDRDSLLHNWNKRYYSVERCDDFNMPESCWLKAIKFNDLERFEAMYPEMTKRRSLTYKGLYNLLSFAALKAAQYGKHEILQYIIDDKGLDNIKFAVRTETLPLFSYAAAVPYNNVEMLKYLYDLGLVERSYFRNSILRIVKKGAHADNIRFLTTLPDYAHHVGDTLMQIAARQGDLTLFRELEKPEIDQDMWRKLYEDALISGNDDMIRYVMFHLDGYIQDITMYSISGLIYDRNAGPEYKSLRHLLEMPEVDNGVVKYLTQRVVSMSKSSPRYDLDTVLGIIAQSGKITPEEIELIRKQK